MPFFSIIIPAYNRRDTLLESIRGVQRQTFADYQCWITDDASTDGTYEMLKKLSLDSRFHISRNETNRRQHYCRNRAIERSNTDWITFLDADDVWFPERLQAFADAIQSSPETGFWFSNGYWLEGDHIVGSFFEDSRLIPTGILPGYYAVGNLYLPYVTTNVAVRRRHFGELGLFREDMRILEDTEFYARLLAAQIPVGVIRKKLSLYRLHPQQITHDHVLEFQESMTALDAGEAPPSIKSVYQKDLVRKTAWFLVKSLHGKQARKFLYSQNAGLDNRILWLASWAPTLFLKWMKSRHRAWKRRTAVSVDEENRVMAYRRSLHGLPS